MSDIFAISSLEDILPFQDKYLEYWLDRNKFVIDKYNNFVSDSKIIEFGNVDMYIWQDYTTDLQLYNIHIKKKKIKGFSKSDLVGAIQIKLLALKEARLKEVVKSIECKKEDDEEITKWLIAVTGKPDKLDICVMSHWLWQIKRRLNDKSVDYQVMPVIYSRANGTGKSKAVKMLTNILSEYRMTKNFEQLTNKRETASIIEKYINVSDEMPSLSKVDLDKLKELITQDTVSYMPIYKNYIVVGKQNCSFIGTSNKQITESIFDSSGMRRFWQINALETKCDWDLVNSIDYIKLWSGINENRPVGYIPDYAAEINEKQQELITKTDVELFLEEFNITAPKDEDLKFKVSPDLLFSSFREWSFKNNMHGNFSSNRFFKSLINFGFKKGRANQGRFYYINVDHTCPNLGKAIQGVNIDV